VTAAIARPETWGGFRLEVAAIELWVEGEYRIHDRARWTRESGGRWSATRLQP
jgi:pyridoxamine 5'-phosphate oxidase